MNSTDTEGEACYIISSHNPFRKYQRAPCYSCLSEFLSLEVIIDHNSATMSYFQCFYSDREIYFVIKEISADR